MALKIVFQNINAFDAFGKTFTVTFTHWSGKVRHKSFINNKMTWMKCMKTCVTCSLYPGLEWCVADNVNLYGNLSDIKYDDEFNLINNYAHALLLCAKCPSDNNRLALNNALTNIKADKISEVYSTLNSENSEFFC